jgi:hypothetical protein
LPGLDPFGLGQQAMAGGQNGDAHHDGARRGRRGDVGFAGDQLADQAEATITASDVASCIQT